MTLQDSPPPDADWPPPEPPDVRAEAIAEHRAVVRTIDATLAKLASELAPLQQVTLTKRSPADQARVDELEDRLLLQKANRQAELDRIATLESGTIVHTRTEWDEREHGRFVAKVRKEVDDLAVEDHYFARLGDYAARVEGPQGEQLQRWVQRELSKAATAPDRLGTLRKIASAVQQQVGAQELRRQAANADEEAWAGLGEDVATGLKLSADLAIMAGALFAPPVAFVAMGYGAGTGLVEGGPKKGLENGLRACSDTIDVAWAGWDGYWAKDPTTGEYRGWSGAAWGAGTTLATNLVMARLGEAFHGRTPDPRSNADLNRRPEFDAFKSNEQRLDDEMAALRKTFGAKADETNPAFKAAADAVRLKFDVVARRNALAADQVQITRDFEQRIPRECYRADGSVETSHAEYQRVKKEWEAALQQSWDAHNVGYEQRMQEHRNAIEEAGLNRSDDKDTHQIVMAGGFPKSIKSDIDMAANDLDSGRQFIAAMRRRGHNAVEYADRWVITDTDTTIWKPKKQAGPVGSSTWEARIELDTEPGSDAFPTPGGVHFTTNGKQGVRDPRGAVIANMKKATEAGLGGRGQQKPDLHVIGKSADKAVEISREVNPAEPVGDAEFAKRARGVREHQPPEQAGITTFGNPAHLKDAEQRKFLQQAREVMRAAYRNAATSSSDLERERMEALKKALARGDRDEASRLRYELIVTRAANEAALRSITHQDRALADAVTKADLPGTIPDAPAPKAPPRRGYGWLWSDVWDGVGRGAPPSPSTPPEGTTPELERLKRRSSRAVAAIDRQSAACGAPRLTGGEVPPVAARLAGPCRRVADRGDARRSPVQRLRTGWGADRHRASHRDGAARTRPVRRDVPHLEGPSVAHGTARAVATRAGPGSARPRPATARRCASGRRSTPGQPSRSRPSGCTSPCSSSGLRTAGSVRLRRRRWPRSRHRRPFR